MQQKTCRAQYLIHKSVLSEYFLVKLIFCLMLQGSARLKNMCPLVYQPFFLSVLNFPSFLIWLFVYEYVLGGNNKDFIWKIASSDSLR